MRHAFRVNRFCATLGFVIAVGCPAFCQWSADAKVNVQLASGTGAQALPRLINTSDDSAYMGWFCKTSDKTTLRLQKLDVAGVAQWGPSGITLADLPKDATPQSLELLCDEHNNAIATFSTNAGLHACMINPEGQMQWGGKTLCVTANIQASPSLALTTDGDTAIVWPSTEGIHMQRIAPDGAFRFQAGGLCVTPSLEKPSLPKLIPSLNGEVILSWVNGQGHLLAQRFDNQGATVWPQASTIQDKEASAAQVLPDGLGGIVACWHCTNGGQINSYVQRLTEEGEAKFANNGLAVSSKTTHNMNPVCTLVPSSNEVFVFWVSADPTTKQWGVYGQRIGEDGVKHWSDNGQELAPMSAQIKSDLRVVTLEPGAICLWKTLDEGQTDRIYGKFLDNGGIPMWGLEPALISSAPSRKSGMSMIIDSQAATKIVWEDDRNGGSIFGQNINADGTLGVPARR